MVLCAAEIISGSVFIYFLNSAKLEHSSGDNFISSDLFHLRQTAVDDTFHECCPYTGNYSTTSICKWPDLSADVDKECDKAGMYIPFFSVFVVYVSLSAWPALYIFTYDNWYRILRSCDFPEHLQLRVPQRQGVVRKISRDVLFWEIHVGGRLDHRIYRAFTNCSNLLVRASLQKAYTKTKDGQ